MINSIKRIRKNQMLNRSDVSISQSRRAPSNPIRWLTFLILFILLVTPHFVPSLQADEPCWANFDLGNPDELHLVAFCEQALFNDRGLTISPFVGGSDNWILQHLLPNEEFRKALIKSEATSEFADLEALKESLEESLRAAAGEEAERKHPMMSSDYATEELFQKLSPEEQKRLPGLYLRMEGLLTLLRPDFAKLFENPETPEKILSLAEIHGERAAMFHRGLFSSSQCPEDNITICKAGLRRASADLDNAILCLLTPLERQRVVTLLRKSNDLQPYIKSPQEGMFVLHERTCGINQTSVDRDKLTLLLRNIAPEGSPWAWKTHPLKVSLNKWFVPTKLALLLEWPIDFYIDSAQRHR